MDQLQPRKVLVTGGAGFIGSHIVEALLKQNMEVHVLDNLSTGRAENVPPEARLIEGSILDDNAIRRALDGVEAVVHLAARVAIRDSIEHFHQDAETNLLGTLRLLRQCVVSNVERFLFASSMAVYADSEKPEPIAEDYSLEPISPYGVSKLAAEKYVRLLAESSGMKGNCLRFFNVYGPRQSFTPYVGVITIFIEGLMQGRPPVVFGSGQQQRDFIHVEDIARASLLVLESDIAGETFNVGTGIGTSVNQIATVLIDKMSPGLEPLQESAKPGEIKNSIANISKLQKALTFQPQGSLLERIDEVIAWKQRTGIE